MRLEISRKTHLAIEAIWVLDDLQTRVQGAPLANAIGTSPAFLAQVMAPLVRHGWIDSVTGRSGGYALAVDQQIPASPQTAIAFTCRSAVAEIEPGDSIQHVIGRDGIILSEKLGRVDHR